MSLRDDAAILNRILGCEHAAVETYDHLVRTRATAPQVWDIQRIAEAHRQAVGRLRRQVELLGGDPETGQGASPWPEIERTSGTRLHEDKSVLLALRQGEMRELTECERALREESDYAPARSLLEERIVPMLQHHIDVLNGYLIHTHA